MTEGDGRPAPMARPPRGRGRAAADSTARADPPPAWSGEPADARAALAGGEIVRLRRAVAEREAAASSRGPGGDAGVRPVVGRQDAAAGFGESGVGRRREGGRRGHPAGQRHAAGREGIPGHPEDAPGDPESVARAICLRLLTAQPRSRAELATALARRGVPAEAAETVLSRFAEVGLIDDRAFAAAWVDSRHVGRGLGRRALAAELRRRGIDDRTTADAVATLDPGTEEATARALVRRKLRSSAGLAPEVQARRVVAMLARRGYSADLSLRLLREELAGSDELVDCELDVETD